jgi:spermidine synthase
MHTALLNVPGVTALPWPPTRADTESAKTAPAQEAPLARREASGGKLPMGLVARGLDGRGFMSLEVLASRSLALIVGPSSQAFALVLMAFILGIGVGSAIIASPRLRATFDEISVARLLLAAGVGVALYVLSIEKWLLFYSAARSGLASNAVGFLYHQGLVGFMALIVLGVPAGLLGAILPLSIRLIDSATLAGQVGRLLTEYRRGGGGVFTGFILMPAAGCAQPDRDGNTLILGAVSLLDGQLRLAGVALLWCIGFRRWQQTGHGW